jgi:hypothetical protein
VGSVDGVIVGDRQGMLDTEIETQKTQQPFEESPTAMTGSPVSSVGGWRQNGNPLAQKQQQGLSF